MTYREDLEDLAAGGCQTPGCTHEAHGEVWLHGRCHQESPLWARYVAGSGVLELTCSKCTKLVAAVAVASKLAEQC